ncbi:MAG: MerR family transcriptional regulator [Gilvibacter sp.]
MYVKTQFNIKDLENLSGVKAHTIRIWEKRYNLLEPNRTDTNIRKYDLESLKKLLNVTYLYNEGFKISKIARLSDSEIQHIIEDQSSENKYEYALNAFKKSMFDFDYELFSSTEQKLMADLNLREIFLNVYLPLLMEIGTLWQTGTIDPAHERFISELIKQRIIVAITQQQAQQTPDKSKPVFALYLPYQEIHEIGLLYAHYEVLAAGYPTIYLGNNIPLSSLRHVLKHYDNVKFITYMTVQPDTQSIMEYLKDYQQTICTDKSYPLWLMGWKTRDVDPNTAGDNIKTIGTIEQLIEAL